MHPWAVRSSWATRLWVVLLGWGPAVVVTYRLQSADTLPAGNAATTVPGPPALAGGFYRLTNSVSATAKYYWLAYP